MEKAERPKIEEKKGWKVSGHTVEEKCRVVLSIWTQRRKPAEVCQELEVSWSVLSQCQDRAMEGMLWALQSQVTVKKGMALNPRLGVLLERKSKGGVMKGLGRRLTRLQSKARLCERNPIKSGGLQEIGV